MIKISRLADYATVIMGFLAITPGERYSATQIARANHMALPTVSKVLKLLNDADLVSSARGVNGGYHLVRLPMHISIGEIITAIDGRPALTECSSDVHGCVRGDICQLRGNWQFINHIVVGVLNNVTLADMGRPLVHSLQLQQLTNNLARLANKGISTTK